jgi:hypothetical protein
MRTAAAGTMYTGPGERMSRDSQRHYSVDDYFMVEEMSEVHALQVDSGIEALHPHLPD